MQNTETKKYEFEIYEAIIFGIMLCFALPWTSNTEAIPLFDFFPEFFSDKLVPILITLIWIFVLFQKKYFKTLILLIISCILIVCTFRYSSNFAFRYFTLYIVGFIFVLNNRPVRERTIASSLILAALFLFSAIHKINDNYLSGVEFEKGGTFISFYELWFPGFIPRNLNSLMTYLPHISILIEFIISIGLMLKPRLFVHIAGVFLLVLCILNPPVLSVYFMLLPLFINISTGYDDLLKKLPFADFLKSPYFWAFYIYVSTARVFKLDTVIITNFIFLIFFTVLHMLVIMRHKHNKDLVLQFSASDFKNSRVWIIPGLMLLTFIASFIILPSPFGFKMFSGTRFDNYYYAVTIDHRDACYLSETRWALSPVADVSWRRLDSDSCTMVLPTQGAVHYVARRLCEKFDSAKFETRNSDIESRKFFGCQDIGQL